MKINENQLRKIVRKVLNESALIGSVKAAGDFVLLAKSGNVIANPYNDARTASHLAKKATKTIFKRGLPPGVQGLYRVVGHEGGKAILAKCNAQTGKIIASQIKNTIPVPANIVSKGNILFMSGMRGSKFKMVTDAGTKVASTLIKGKTVLQIVPYTQKLLLPVVSSGGLSVITTPPTAEMIKGAKGLLARNPAMQKKLAEKVSTGLLDATGKKVTEKVASGVVIELAANGAGGFGMKGASVAKALSTTVAISTAAIPAAAGLTAGQAVFQCLFGWPSLVGMAAYFTGSWLHDWAIGDTKELINSIKRNAKDKLGLLYGPSGYDFTDDKEFTQAALEKNFDGLKPSGVDFERRKKIFDLILQRYNLRKAGLTINNLEASNDIKRAYKLIESGYLSNTWFNAAIDYDKKTANVDITVQSQEQKTDEDLLDLPGSESGDAVKKKKSGGDAQKKKSGWGNHPPEMKEAWLDFLQTPDSNYAEVHGPKGGTYREWQRWYMTATKDSGAWELIKKPKGKYLNNSETIQLLKILKDPNETL